MNDFYDLTMSTYQYVSHINAVLKAMLRQRMIRCNTEGKIDA